MKKSNQTCKANTSPQEAFELDLTLEQNMFLERGGKEAKTLSFAG